MSTMMDLSSRSNSSSDNSSISTTEIDNRIDATLETIEAMCKQEQEGYKTCDYLSENFHTNDDDETSSTTNTTTIVLDIDVESRSKMAAWCFDIVEFCDFNTETVAIAMNLLDRFMATSAGSVAKADRGTFQLAAMTALYTSVKIHEPEALDPKTISRFSRGTYLPQEVEDMEAEMLQAVQWRVNPPTAMAFCRSYLDLVFPAMDAVAASAAQTVLDLARLQIDLAVAEYNFCCSVAGGVTPSVLAYGALMNALTSVGVDAHTLETISSTLFCATLMTSPAQQRQVRNIQKCLSRAIALQSNGTGDNADDDADGNHVRNKTITTNKTSDMQQPDQIPHDVSPRSTTL